jgi:hypothetical protein
MVGLSPECWPVDYLQVAPACDSWKAIDISSQVQPEAAAPDSATRPGEPG